MDEAHAAKTVLVVDDSPYWTDTIADGLRREGYVVSALHDGLAAVERLRNAPPHVLVTDYFLANLDGGKLCQLAKQLPLTPSVKTIILTGGADRKHWRAPSAYADAVIAKNSVDIVLGDLRSALKALTQSVPPPSVDPREVIGHERLHPRSIAKKLHGMKQYLDALHEGIGDAVIGIDSQQRVYFLNSVALELLDVTEHATLARPIAEVLGVPNDHLLVELVRRAIEGQASSGRPLSVEIQGNSLRVTVAGIQGQDGLATAVIIARDISDLKAAELARAALDARLNESAKLSSLGRMVAGVAHEINNPLAAMLPNLKVLRELLDELAAEIPESAMHERLASFMKEAPIIADEVIEAGDRIGSIVAEMRNFSYPTSQVGELVRLEELLEAPLSLAAGSLRPKATVERVYRETPPIVVDRARLSQAFLNIILNAAQAIPTSDPSTNRVRVETRAEAGGVVVEIGNTGPAIPKDLVPKIFEPFFTTKSVGEGVGLGLSITYETIRTHGGSIEVFSAPDQLTTFRVWLPLDTGRTRPSTSAPARVVAAGSARVLIVDDDRLVRNSLRRMLERQHDVVLASGGERALELLGQEKFDVVLCDLVMPQMSGMELHAAVSGRSPEQAARFVFLTGGTHSSEARQFLQSVPNPRAYKPVSAEEVGALIARSLYEHKRL